METFPFLEPFMSLFHLGTTYVLVHMQYIARSCRLQRCNGSIITKNSAFQRSLTNPRFRHHLVGTNTINARIHNKSDSSFCQWASCSISTVLKSPSRLCWIQIALQLTVHIYQNHNLSPVLFTITTSVRSM